MDVILKKKKKRDEALTNRCAFPSTDKMKTKIDEIKATTAIDVNEMLREYAQKIIDQADKEKELHVEQTA